MQWYSGKVLHGGKKGKALGYPTINLDPTIIPQNLRKGVYAALVKYDNNLYRGALFFGPRVILNETKNVLEIFIFDFDKEIYGQDVEFQIRDFIREVENFSSMEDLSAKLAKDVKKIRHVTIFDTEQ